MNDKETKTIKLNIYGLVQGVGFRPFIYRHATENSLNGIVENNTDSVMIIVEGQNKNIETFVKTLKAKSPPASRIESMYIEEIDHLELDSFNIVRSKETSGDVTEVSPDIAVCSECLIDLKTTEHRKEYPLINCTNCGPRFTIIKELPYDRNKTTMNKFEMCEICETEYNDVLDRRFHAQPVSCNYCGPVYTFNSDSIVTTNISEIIFNTANVLDSGGIVALKGTGGYNLVCSAHNVKAVQKLRDIKHREAKPFALMVKDIETVKKYAELNDIEIETLTSFRRPIVLLRHTFSFHSAITSGLSTVAVMLPSLPFHYMLFEKLTTDMLVATSGNISDEPILIDDKKAIQTFLPQVNAVISYNREIHNRCDDSVVFISQNVVRTIRRARGFVPESIQLPFECESIAAVGGELKNTFCIGKGTKAIISQHIGDIKNLETSEFFEESFERFQHLFQSKPLLLVHDLHPDYLTTRYAKKSQIKSLPVQHHWAHITSVMAEHSLSQPVIGFAFDGTGYGTDGNIWGGEILIADFNSFKRVSHLEYVPLPGGDKAVKECWRYALSLLYHAFGTDWKSLKIPFIQKFSDAKNEIILEMIKKEINSPLTSSMGRLFDGIAAMIGVNEYSRYEAESAMLLESAATDSTNANYIMEPDGIVKLKPLIAGIVTDISKGMSAEFISTKFHNTIAEFIVQSANKYRDDLKINRVAISGGVFFNRYLLEQAETQLLARGFEVYSNCRVPSGDGGISLGQLAIGANINL
jgi:hydrogenase maturation protein HypF